MLLLSTKTECDYLNGWITKQSHTQKSHPKVVNPRDLAGERTHTQKKKKALLFLRQLFMMRVCVCMCVCVCCCCCYCSLALFSAIEHV